MYRFWKLALILSVVTGWAASQNSPAHVPQPVVSTRLNNPTTLNCDSHGQPLSVCLWERNVDGQRSVISINPGSDQNGRATPQAGITYAGEGLNSGKCGINIESIKENDSGRWSCTLIGANGGIFIGTVDVTILRKPGAPEFDASLGVLNEGDTKDINCYSANGQPPPTFQWFIGDTPVDSKELKPIGNNTNNNVAYTFQTLRHTFTWQDSGKQLRCVIVSEALTKEDKVEVSQDISVYYAPKSSEEQVTIRVPELGTQASLAINISSNPAPRIQWQTSKFTLVAGNKSPDQRFEARMPKQVGPDLYLCELNIDKVEEGDLNVVYKLIAQNQQGSANFELRLSSAAEASTGLSAGGIVGLVLGIPLILIVVALIVVYTRAKGLLCFKDGGDSHSTAHIEGATSENGDRGNENPVGDHEGYPPSSQTPPLAKTNGNGNHAPPPAPTVRHQMTKRIPCTTTTSSMGDPSKTVLSKLSFYFPLTLFFHFVMF